jgi:hypothetical protein
LGPLIGSRKVPGERKPVIGDDDDDDDDEDAGKNNNDKKLSLCFN